MIDDHYIETLCTLQNMEAEFYPWEKRRASSMKPTSRVLCPESEDEEEEKEKKEEVPEREFISQPITNSSVCVDGDGWIVRKSTVKNKRFVFTKVKKNPHFK